MKCGRLRYRCCIGLWHQISQICGVNLKCVLVQISQACHFPLEQDHTYANLLTFHCNGHLAVDVRIQPTSTVEHLWGHYLVSAQTIMCHNLHCQ